MSKEVADRAAFSTRLKGLLVREGYVTTSPTNLARHFNLRYKGDPVTVHAVRKWLFGLAVPSRTKVMTLCSMLNSTPEYLVYGLEESQVPVDTETTLKQEDAEFLVLVSRLPVRDQLLIREFARMLHSTRGEA
jgi:hypothetical protein